MVAINDMTFKAAVAHLVDAAQAYALRVTRPLEETSVVEQTLVDARRAVLIRYEILELKVARWKARAEKAEDARIAMVAKYEALKLEAARWKARAEKAEKTKLCEKGE